jgi:hypothetical protein
MVYEWDARRARRTHFVKLGLSLLGGLVIAGVPAWVAITMDIL